MDRLILLIFLFLCPPLVRSEAQQGRSYKDKLVFGRSVRRGVSSARKRNMIEFVGGKIDREGGRDGGINVNLENKYYL